MSEKFVSTIQLCEEIGLSRNTVNKLRADGVLIPGAHFYRGHGRRIFSDNTSRQWDAVATSTSPPGSGDTSIYTLVEGEGRKDGKFKIWRSNLVSGNLISQARWKTEQAMVNEGYESLFNYDINDNGYIGS